MSYALPDLLDADDVPDLLGYDDPVRIYRYRAAAGDVDPNTGRLAGRPPETVVYDDVADVQDGMAALAQLPEGAGEREAASAVCYLPASAPLGSVRVDDRIDTPIGRGSVLEIHRDDRALVLTLTSPAAAE